jgi:hypothetical protein
LCRRELHFGNRRSFKDSGCGRGSPVSSFGTLAFGCRFRCASRVPFFGSWSCRVLGGASFIVGNATDPALLSCCGFGTPSGDKWNAGHSDPVPLRHELGQGWSAAKPNPDAIINTLLQPRPYLQNSGGNMSK